MMMIIIIMKMMERVMVLCNDDDGVSEEKWKGMDGKMNNEMVCGQNEKKGVIMITSCTHNIIYLYI